MKYDTALSEGNKAARATFSLFTNATTIDDIVYDQVWAMGYESQALATKLYTNDIPARDLALANGINDLDWLHGRDDIIDVYLDVVARWAVVDIRHTIDKHTTRQVIDKMKGRIKNDLKNEVRLLCRRVQDAFMKKYEHLDRAPLCGLHDIFDYPRAQKSWHKVLPIVLEAIDTKMDVQHAEGNEIHNPIVLDEDEGSHDSTLEKPKLAGQHFVDI